MSKYIVLDLETIYLAEEKINKIIEIGFLIIENNEVIREYSQLVNPGRKINDFVQNLTSISNEALKEAPYFKDIYEAIIPLFKDHILVAHQAELDMKTINDELNLLNQPALENKTIDTVELSKILLPEESSYKLTDLAVSLKINFHVKEAHRALVDAKITTRLFFILKEKLENLPKNALYHLRELLPYLISDLEDLFISILKHKEQDDAYAYYNDLPYREPVNFKKHNRSLINYELFLTQVYKDEGYLSHVYNNYNYRKDQVKISEEIKQLFNQHQHGLIEAPTGIGKSIGYLLPALYEALKTGERIIISTHTTQLQSQLMHEDINKLNHVLSFQFNVQILKGKRNYLDIKRFYSFLKMKRNDTYPLVIFKAKLIVWLTETTTGLFSDLNIEANMKQYLFEIETLERDHPYSFYYFAFKKAYSADLILVNHALLIADINTNGLLIPQYNKVIIDEAQQFKNLMVENKNLLLSSSKFIPFLKYLIKKTDYEALKVLEEELNRLIEGTFKHAKIESKTKVEMKYLFSSQDHSGDQLILEDFNTLFGYFELCINKLKNDSQIDEKIVNEFIEYQVNLDNMINNLEKNLSLYITFIQDKSRLSWSIYSQKNEQSDQLLKRYYKDKQSIIYLSATLTIRHSFKYMLDQLNLEADTYTLQLPTPFNLTDQTRLLVPNDFPAIKDEKNYISALSELIYSISQSIGGGILTLFTSYQMLQASYDLLSEFIHDDFTLLAQGITDTNREQLINKFKNNQPAILLGTASFWEGVDIQGDALSCLILTRLPFQQINHPTFRIEAERLKKLNMNSFFEYALPEAVLKFRQGVGRLIRNENDKGFIFVLDNRLKEANYKKYFTESIEPINTKYLDTKNIIKKIEASKK